MQERLRQCVFQSPLSVSCVLCVDVKAETLVPLGGGSEQVGQMALMSPPASESGATWRSGAKTNIMESKSWAQATGGTLRGIDCYELDEKHIVTYILSCRPPALIMWLLEYNKGFCVDLNSNQRGEEGECVWLCKKKKEKAEVFLTVFVTRDRNVVHSSEFETGAGQDLELHRAQQTRLEIWETHSWVQTSTFMQYSL